MHILHKEAGFCFSKWWNCISQHWKDFSPVSIQGQVYGPRLSLSAQVGRFIGASHLTLREFLVPWFLEAPGWPVNGYLPCYWLSSVGLLVSPRCTFIWVTFSAPVTEYSKDMPAILCWLSEALSSPSCRNSCNSIMPVSIQKWDLWLLRIRQTIVSDFRFSGSHTW